MQSEIDNLTSQLGEQKTEKDETEKQLNEKLTEKEEQISAANN